MAYIIVNNLMFDRISKLEVARCDGFLTRRPVDASFSTIISEAFLHRQTELGWITGSRSSNCGMDLATPRWSVTR